MGAALEQQAQRVVDRYAIYDRIAAGGMAVVHVGRLLGQAGFARTVAVKQLHAQFASDPAFVEMFLDEARLTARIQHPNVVAPLDIVMRDDEMLVVMEYVSGETLARLGRVASETRARVEPAIVASVMIDALSGLHAAHEASSEDGTPLCIVHRDVSPQNIMVGVDGIARVLDFGVAKASLRTHATREGEIKGKLAYMAPEQLAGGAVDRRADVFAAGVVMWEALTGRRLFRGDDLPQTVQQVLTAPIPPPSAIESGVSAALDAVVLRALARELPTRFQTAQEFALAVEAAEAPAPASTVGDWVRRLGGAMLRQRLELVASIESSSMRRSADHIRLSAPLRLQAVGPVETTEVPLSDGEVPSNRHVRASHTAIVANATPEDRTERRGNTHRFALLGGAAVIGVGLLAFVLRTSDPPRASTAEPLPRAAERAAGQPSPAARIESGAGATAAVVAEPAPVATQSAAARSATSAEPGVSRPAAKRRSPSPAARTAAPASSARAAAAAKTNCTPPYYLDAKNIRRIKPGCI